MIRSRTEIMRKRKQQRRRRLAAANLCLLGAIAAVLLWNGLSIGNESERSAEPPIMERIDDAPSDPAEVDSIEPAESEDVAKPEDTPKPQDTADPQDEAETAVGKETGEGTEDESGDLTDGRQNEGSSVRLAFVGDVLLGSYVETLMKRNGFEYPYMQVKQLLQDADVTAANLETAVTGERKKAGLKQYEFRSPPEALPAFVDAGFDVVSLANNHTLDFGPEGLRDTIRHLNDNSIRHVGAGENADEAFAPEYVEKNGLTIAYLGLSRVVPNVDWKAGKNKLGVAETYDYRRAVEEIGKAKEQADVVVVMAHWGNERELKADPLEQTDLGRRYIDAGADLVIGSHPHVLQGIESYKDKWIVYSLGNFIFTTSKDPLTYDSGILYADCDHTGACGLQLVPVKADSPQPAPMEVEEASEVIERVSSYSVNAVLNEDGHVSQNGNPKGT